MTSQNRPRRRADQFAALLDATPVPGAPGHVAGGRADRELAGLLQLVGTLRDYPAASGLEILATPTPAHTTLLRERLMTEAADVLTPERAERHAVLTLPPRTRGGRERRLAAAATVLVVLGGTTGMAAASERALPGQALYPVKRGIERVDVALSTSTAGQGRDVLHQASTRLVEVRGLAEGPPEGIVQIPATLSEFTRQAKEGANLMIKAYQETADPSTLQTVQDFAANEGTQVRALAKSPDVEVSLSAAADTLYGISSAADIACTIDCPQIDPVLVSATVPPSMRAADGSELGTGDLPPELGSVPPVTDGGTIVEPTAPVDGSGTVEALPGLADDPASSSPLPPVDGTGTGTGTDPGAGTGDQTTGPSSAPTDSSSPGPSQSEAPTPTPTPTPSDSPTPVETPTPSDPPTPVETPTPSDTASAPDSASPSDSPPASDPTDIAGDASAPSGPTDVAGDAQSADAGDGAGGASP